MEISIPRQLLGSLGPLPETSARTPPNFREVPPEAVPMRKLVGNCLISCALFQGVAFSCDRLSNGRNQRNMSLSGMMRIKLSGLVPLVSKQGSTATPWARGLRNQIPKWALQTQKKKNTFISRVFCAERWIATMVSDHGLGRGYFFMLGNFDAGGKQEHGRELCAEFLWIFCPRSIVTCSVTV